MTDAPQARRRDYLDWLRGVAVLLMIAAHMLDSWVGEPDRSTALYRFAIAVGGMGTVFFLLLAGVAVGLSAGSKLRRSGSANAAFLAVVRRGLELFALAFVFRVQALFVGWSPNARDLLKVDILNIMGPSIVLAALLWRVGGTLRRRAVTFAVATAAIAFATPVIRTLDWSGLPDPLEAYIVPVSGLSNLVFLPWAGLVSFGAFLGVAIDAAIAPDRERVLNTRFAIGGGLLAGLALAASYLPSPFANSYFWTTSPAYFFLRAGLTTMAIAAAYLWTSRFVRRGQWSPLMQLGWTSLFIYWIHVELIYGLISRPIHRTLSLPQAVVAYVFFTGFMLVCSIAKERIAQAYRPVRATRSAA